MPLLYRKKEGAPLIQPVFYYKPSDCLFQTTPTPTANGENEFLPPAKPFSFKKVEVRSLKHVMVPACDYFSSLQENILGLNTYKESKWPADAKKTKC